MKFSISKGRAWELNNVFRLKGQRDADSMWTLVVAIVALGSASMICLPLSGFDSKSEHGSDSLKCLIS
jgi:hypothetical protein